MSWKLIDQLEVSTMEEQTGIQKVAFWGLAQWDSPGDTGWSWKVHSASPLPLM